MANDAVGQEKQKEYIIQKLISFLFKVPLRRLPSSKLFEPCDSLSAKGPAIAP